MVKRLCESFSEPAGASVVAFKTHIFPSATKAKIQDKTFVGCAVRQVLTVRAPLFLVLVTKPKGTTMTRPKATSHAPTQGTVSVPKEERTASTKPSSGQVIENDDGGVVAVAESTIISGQVQPGAVHVQGFGRRVDDNSSGTDSDFEEESPRPEVDDNDDDGLVVTATLAPSELVAPTTTSIPPSSRNNNKTNIGDVELGDADEKPGKSLKDSRYMSDRTFMVLIIVLVVLVFLAVGIIVGVVVGLNNDSSSSSPNGETGNNDIGNNSNNNGPTSAPTAQSDPREAEIALRRQCPGLQRWAPSQSLPLPNRLCPVNELGCDTATTICPEYPFEESDLYADGPSVIVFVWAENRNRCPGLQRYSPDPEEEEDCPIEAGCDTATPCPELPYDEWASS